MIEIKSASGGGAIVQIPGTGNKVFTVANIPARNLLTTSIEDDFCQVLNASIPADPSHPVIGYFVRTAVVDINDPGAWIQIKFQQEKFDAGYLTLIASSDTELNAAIALLNANASGGTILLKNAIHLTANYSWNLDNITINGRSHNFWIDGFFFTITSRTCRFLDVWFTGSQTTDIATFITQRMCYISNSDSVINSLDYYFEGCEFIRMVGTGLIPVIDVTALGYLKITFKRCITIVQDISFVFEALNVNFAAGLQTINIIVQESGGTSSGANNYRATGTLGSLTPTASYNFFITDGSGYLVTTNGLALTKRFQTSTLGTKEVDEALLADKFLPYYDNATQKFIFKSINQIAIDLNIGYVTVGATLGQYATIELAFAAGKYNIFLVEDITLAADQAFTLFTLNIVINSNNKTITTNGKYWGDVNSLTVLNTKIIFTYAVNWYVVKVNKALIFNCEITYANTTGYFITTVSNPAIFDNCIITQPSNGSSNNLSSNHIYNKCIIIGAGSAKVYSNFRNCNFQGSFDIIGMSGIFEGNRGTASGRLTSQQNTTRVNFINNIMRGLTLLSYFGGGDNYYTDMVLNGCIFYDVNLGLTETNKKADWIDTEFVRADGTLTLSAQVIKMNKVKFNRPVTVTTAKIQAVECEFLGLTIAADNELIGCIDTGLTISSNANVVSGGEHGAIAVNGNDNSVQNTRKAASIVVNGANLRNIITGNHCDTAITPVAGNEFNNNSEY